MSPSRKLSDDAMLELWRPTRSDGDPIGCLATTYTFAPELFDEQCLARFLDIDSEPDRESLPFLLERESRLGSVYAGVLVDHTQAGVAHSLRWDVLPVRIRGAKQHAKVSLLAWSRHVRLIIASANLTQPGYRFNREVVACVDLTPDSANQGLLEETLGFLRQLLALVPGAAHGITEVARAEEFLIKVERLTRRWSPDRGDKLRRKMVFTLPARTGRSSQSSLDEAIDFCRTRGRQPSEARIVSPFYDQDAGVSRVTEALRKQMSRFDNHTIYFGVPGSREESAKSVPRLYAPIALWKSGTARNGEAFIELLPNKDDDGNQRDWHAKMMAFISKKEYSAVMAGSSNFTCAGMGIGEVPRNAEANIVMLGSVGDGSGDADRLGALFPKMELIRSPESAEWLSQDKLTDEDGADKAIAPPSGFVSATYQAGDTRKIVLRLDGAHLPSSWRIETGGRVRQLLLDNDAWQKAGSPARHEIEWPAEEPPELLHILWEGREAQMPLNVEDAARLPPLPQLGKMSADEMLRILAATDPSAAIRAWAKHQAPTDEDDDGLDSAVPIDLDPLHRYDLQTTFLHRVRRRARIMAQLKVNLEKPALNHQTLNWRLRGMIGIEALADRLLREFEIADGNAGEALLSLSDLLVVLREVTYREEDGYLSASGFEQIYRPFLATLAGKLDNRVSVTDNPGTGDLRTFWSRVVKQCAE